MITFSFPIPEKISTNRIYSGLHWAKRNSLKNLYHSQLLEFKNKFKINQYPIKIAFRFVWTKTPLDCSNCSFMAKMIEDGMVENKIIKNDTPEYVSAIALISEIDSLLKNDTVFIAIE